MATRYNGGVLWTFLITAVLSVTFARIPDLGVVQSLADKLDLELKNLADDVTGINDLQEAYVNREKDITFKAVDGSELVDTMAESLAAMLGKKISALKRSVEWAEKVAAEYKWNPDLELTDVEYVHSKRINDSDPDFQYSEKFQQKVSFQNSSVHIPVEIYEGDIDILNGLAWTNQLDEQWKANLEKDPELLWQYFGSQTGIMRNFPGSKKEESSNKWRSNGVDLYDVRRRPWYTQGASSPKDMLILVDTSGSTHGQALALMKQAVKSLLDTLGENDFVNVAMFSEDAKWIGCFKTFVQANYRNKQELKTTVDGIEASGMAIYTNGLEFAFEAFKQFDEDVNRTEGEGANCNRIIMFLTDGGTDMPEEVFQKYNWPEKRIRIFGYAIGPTANPFKAIEWMSCANRGYFYKIPAMGAIRSQVQDYQKKISAPLALGDIKWLQWTNLYSDSHGHVNVVARPLALEDVMWLQWTAPYVSAGRHVSVIGRPLALEGYHPIQWSKIYYDQLIYYEALSQGLVDHQSRLYNWTRLYHDTLEYVSVLARPKAMAYDKQFSWTNVKLDPMGLGMMTTVTLPVYNGTEGSTNQTILGVMGSDVTVEEMERFIPTRKLGPNGYAFAINSNGYIVFHPNLKAKLGWLSEPPNVDLLEVEYETPAKDELRKNMIDSITGVDSIQTWVNVPEERYIDNKTRKYYYTAIPDSSFSLAIVLPEYAKYFVDSIREISYSEAGALLVDSISAVIMADWDYCTNIEPQGNFSSQAEDLIYKITNEYQDCDPQLVQHLLFDAQVTKSLEALWERQEFQKYKEKMPLRDGVRSTFVGTNGGLTRVYPSSENETFQALRNTWDDVYYKRSMDNDLWMYSAPYVSMPVTDDNLTDPVIMSTKAIKIPTYDYKPAVIGVEFTQTRLRQHMFEWVTQCDQVDITCYLLDDGGFLLLSDDPEDRLKVGRYFGSIEPVLWEQMVEKRVFIQREQIDYQGSCPVHVEYNSAARKLVPSIFYEMLTLNWWASKMAWTYLNFNIYNWLFAASENYAYAEEAVPANYTCIKRLAQYHRNPDIDQTEYKDYITCGNCTRTLATSSMKRSNMMLVMVDRDCYGKCDEKQLPQAPEETSDPNFVGDGERTCHITQRYRKRPSCFQFNPNEDDSDCGRGSNLQPSLVILFTNLVMMLFVAKICKS